MAGRVDLPSRGLTLSRFCPAELRGLLVGGGPGLNKKGPPHGGPLAASSGLRSGLESVIDVARNDHQRRAGRQYADAAEDLR